MPRKRMIDPEFWSDEEIGKWSRSARLFYIGLWNFADDCGRFKAHSGLLKSQIFPYDNPKGLIISKLKQEVSNKIVWYDVNSSQYGYLRNFLKHQRIDRPQPSKLPPPPEDKIVEHSPNNQRVILPNISKDNISKDNIKPSSFSFEEIYIKYPNKVGKKAALRHFEVSVKTSQDWQDIQTALKNYLESARVAKGYVMNASTFFNNWRDWVNFKEPLCPKCKGKGTFISTTGYEIICDCSKGKGISGITVRKPL